MLQPSPRQVQLSCLDESRGLTLDSLARVTDEISEPEDKEVATISRVTLKELEIHPGPPTALNELQFWIFLDFCFVWRSFIDDSSTWRYPSMGFNTIAIGLLRIAAWDLEVSSDTQIHYSINGVHFPRWEAPQTDIFWFHGCLVVLHRNINTKVSISAAITKAQSFLKFSHEDAARLIILLFRHVAFVEVSSKSVLCTRILPLIVNTSALQCSPGFRLLSYVLSAGKHPLPAGSSSELICNQKFWIWFSDPALLRTHWHCQKLLLFFKNGITQQFRRFNISHYKVLNTPCPAVERRADFTSTGPIARAVTRARLAQNLPLEASTTYSEYDSRNLLTFAQNCGYLGTLPTFHLV
ncbi:hypothetical protein ACJ73_09339 [Blastomyces percursus]|uniref:Uncharacterized protein n=1 Tax=Blastomyces percursus TaxID=1658174 RepID=A0A1J9PXA5_9EURO|nr:hypothetical protein ACJ73_09339 [Blastomyces percursus]